MAACYIPPVTLTLVHSALQQMAASAAPLDQAARVCELMHVGVAQTSTPLQGRPSATGSLLLFRRRHLKEVVKGSEGGWIVPPPPPPPPPLPTQSTCKMVCDRYIRDNSYK